MIDILIDSLLDALKMLPFLLVVYLVIEVLEHRAMDKIRSALGSKKLGVVSGAALGLFPQCGFSVAASNLYAEKLITAGTLIAVFISTSDEAIPIVAANPSTVKWLLPLLLIKFVYAIFAGFAVNFFFRLLKLDELKPHHHSHSEHIHEAGEHHHCVACDSTGGIIKSAVRRSLTVFLYILAIGVILNLVIFFIGEDNLAGLLMTDSIVQPFLAALIGLIPNCAASIVLSQLFIEGTLTFASLVSGLSAGAGVGLLILFGVNHNQKQNCAILGFLYLLAAAVGFVLQFILH